MTDSNSVNQAIKTVTGIIQIPYKNREEENSGESESDDEDDTLRTLMWLDLKDMGALDNSVRSRTLKTIKVIIRDDNGKNHACSGKFALTQIYWKVSVKISRAWLRSVPKYFIRTDSENVQHQNLITIFLSDCLKDHVTADIENAVKACFETFCRTSHAHERIDFLGLEKLLKDYVRQEHRLGCCLGNKTHQQFGDHTQEDHSVYIMKNVFGSELGMTVLRAASHPDLVKTLSELLPFSFPSFLHKLKDRTKLPVGSVSNLSEDEAALEMRIRQCLDDEGPYAAVEIADSMARETPWEFAFKDVISSKLKVYGSEASLNAYIKAGYLQKTPQTERDAIYIYEVLKVDSKRDGHTYMGFRKLWNYYYFKELGYQINGEQRWKHALDYLEQNQVIVRETVDCEEKIFLRHNHQAEVDIAKGVDRLLKGHKENPLKWDVDFSCTDFENIRKDPDQLRASHLICNLPVTVMSGRGGCGKTTVVTKLLKHLCDKEEKRIKEEREVEECCQTLMEDDWNVWEDTGLDTLPPVKGSTDIVTRASDSHAGITQETTDLSSPQENTQTFDKGSPRICRVKGILSEEDSDEKEGSSNLGMKNLSQASGVNISQSQTKSKEDILQGEVVLDLMKILKESKMNSDLKLEEFQRTILLTAPTGKAARLLGCKAKLPSATLHSVIMSWCMYSKNKGDKPWVYQDVEVWVVDECSLVSNRLFAQVINILLSRASLRKVVLLGDIRQLPSIEPGSFLKDIFQTFSRVSDHHFSLGIELTQNHRSESTLIVENAGRISKRELPVFDKDQRFHLVEISDQGDDSERDEAIRYLLKNAEDVKCHTESQFVSFRNAHCRAVNELCCKHYNGHSLLTAGGSGRKERLDFRIGDKICLGKNNRVNNNVKLITEKYSAGYPDFCKALKEKGCERRTGKKNRGEDECMNLQEDNLGKSVLDSDSALSLILGDERTFEESISDMKEHDHKVQVTKREREKEERLKRAKQRKAERREKQVNEGVGQRKGEGGASSKVSGSSLLGQKEEKLCNGEVFFIMDEIDHFEEGDKVATKYLILSDRDPDVPRVVCVPLKVLKRNCRMKHSWVRTIHTYQGSESNTVVYILGKAIPQNWQHVYTAITRGKKSVYIVGNWGELNKAITRRELPRSSRLCSRLGDIIMENSDAVEVCKKDFLEGFNVDLKKDKDETSAGDFSFPDSDDSWLGHIDDENIEGISTVREGNVKTVSEKLIVSENVYDNSAICQMMDSAGDEDKNHLDPNGSRDLASTNNERMDNSNKNFDPPTPSQGQNQIRPKISNYDIGNLINSSEDEDIMVVDLPWQEQNENQDKDAWVCQQRKRGENSFYQPSGAGEVHNKSLAEDVGIPLPQRVLASPTKKLNISTEPSPSARRMDIHKTPSKMDDYQKKSIFSSPTSGPVRKLSLKTKYKSDDISSVSPEPYLCTPPKVSHGDTPVNTPFRNAFSQSLTMSENFDDDDDDSKSSSDHKNVSSVRRKL